MIRNRSDNKRFIFQPTHAQLAKQVFQQIKPALLKDVANIPEVESAIELHDIGWAIWEQQPAINRLTGYPYDFTGIPVDDHLAIWKNCSRIVGKMNSFASLLVSLHTTYLAEKHDSTNDTKRELEAVTNFWDEEQLFRKNLLDSLQQFQAYQDIDSKQLEIMRSWISFCDYVSLLLCMQGFHNQLITDLPERIQAEQIEISQVTDYENRYRVEPWIFKTNEITLQCDSVILNGQYHDSEKLDMDTEMQELQTYITPYTTILQKQK